MDNTSNKGFFRLFFSREVIPLAGKRFSNLAIMSVMLFIAFTVIGFAEGSLRYLEQKMKDPFINWVNVIPKSYEGVSASRLINDMNNELIKDEYNLVNAVGFNRMQYNFYNYNDIVQYYQTGQINNEKIYPFPARTLDQHDPIIPEIFSAKNKLNGFGYYGNMDIGLIITESMIKRLGYPATTPYIWTDFLASKGYDQTEHRVPIPLPVVAVVKALPGMAAWASTTYFFHQRRILYKDNPFNPIRDNRLIIAVHNQNNSIEKLSEIIQKVLNDFNDLSLQDITQNSVFYEQRNTNRQDEYYLIFIDFNAFKPTLNEFDTIFNYLINHNDLKAYRESLFRMYDYEIRLASFEKDSDFERVSINFSKLDKLRQFNIMLRNTYQLEVDMSQIESRENYNFISRLTRILSVVLIGFSIMSVVLFMTYLLKRHLESIKRNIGTFKAFGLSDQIIIGVYVKITLFILSISATIGLLMAAIFGYAGGMKLILLILGAKIEEGVYFSLVSYPLLMALIALVVFSIITLRLAAQRILKSTPGDLIYERE